MLIVLEQRNVVVLTTRVRLIAIWKRKLERWYIVVDSEDKEKEKRNLKSGSRQTYLASFKMQLRTDTTPFYGS